MANTSTDTYILGGLVGLNLNDPAGRWALTEATELPSFGQPSSASVILPGVDGVLSVPSTRVDPITVSLEVLAQRGFENALIGRIRRHMTMNLMFDVVWRPRWQSGYREAPARFQSDLSLSYPGSGQEVLVKFVLEIPRGFWVEYRRDDGDTGESQWRRAISVGNPGTATADLSNSWAPAWAPWVGIQPLGSGTQSCSIRDLATMDIYGFRFLTGGYRYLVDTVNRKVYQGPTSYDVSNPQWIQWVEAGNLTGMTYLTRASQAVVSPQGGIRMHANPTTGQAVFTGATTAKFCLFYKYAF